MDGLTLEDREHLQVLHELRSLGLSESINIKLGNIISKHFVLKTIIKHRVYKILNLLKMWECESGKFNLAEQERLISLLNEQMGDVMDYDF